jgi:hypothetical protein
VLPAISPAHLYYILIGAGPTIFVLAPECRRLAGFDPMSDEAIDAHTDAVLAFLFGTSTPDNRNDKPTRNRKVR